MLTTPASLSRNSQTWLFGTLLLAFTTATTQAAIGGITLTSEAYQLRGRLTTFGSPPFAFEQTYDQSTLTQTTIEVVDPNRPYIYAHSKVDVKPFSLFVETNSAYGSGFAEATGQWDFQTQGSTLSVSFDWGAVVAWLWYTDPFSASLVDKTTGESLLNISANGNEKYNYPNWSLPTTSVFNVDPSHTYSLRLFVRATSYADGETSTFAPSLISVPEPATILCLVPVVLQMRRRKARKT